MTSSKLTTMQILDRIKILSLAKEFGLAHIPGSFSMIDYLRSFYNIIYKHVPKSFFYVDKIYSAGVYYAIFEGLGRPRKLLVDIPEKNIYGSGQDVPCNSLGLAVGHALETNCPVFINVGDSGIINGITHEAAQFAGAKKLSNLLLMVDHNKKGATGNLNFENTNLVKYFHSLGWNALYIPGHNVQEIKQCFDSLIWNEIYKIHHEPFKEDQPFYILDNKKPTCFIFETKKGKGVRDLEEDDSLHAVFLKDEQYTEFQNELMDQLEVRVA